VSYARFGSNGSDVYVYLDVSGYFSCCACGIGSEDGGYFLTTDSLIAHLREHEELGDTVPPDTYTDLEREREENDEWIASQQ